VGELQPFRRPFKLDWALPRAVRGPVDFKALRRLAAIRAGVMMRGLSKDMAASGAPIGS